VASGSFLEGRIESAEMAANIGLVEPTSHTDARSTLERSASAPLWSGR
jgi:hypothetical protein